MGEEYGAAPLFENACILPITHAEDGAPEFVRDFVADVGKVVCKNLESGTVCFHVWEIHQFGVREICIKGKSPSRFVVLEEMNKAIPGLSRGVLLINDCVEEIIGYRTIYPLSYNVI